MWQRIGALEGGTVGGLAIVEDRDGAVVLAVTPAGGFKSTDGQHWHAMSSQPGPALADAIAASPAFARDQTLYLAGRTGLFHSADSGQTWRHALVGEVLSVVISPSFGEDGTVFVGTSQDGVLRSDDRGVTWSGANSGLLDLAVLSVALSPGFADDRTAFVGTASGLYRSRNGGRSWREVRLGLTDVAVQLVAVSPRYGEDRLVLAGTEAHGLLRSDDGGASFSDVPELAERGISALTLSPDGRTVVAAAGDEVVRSDDGGRSWRPLPPAPGLVLGLGMLPTGAGDRMVAGLHRLGVAILDPEHGWQIANDGLRASLLTWLTLSPRFSDDRTMVGLSLDEGLLVSRDAGQSWERRWPEDADPAIAALALGTADADSLTVLASTADTLYRSADSGETWQPLSPEASPPLRVISPLPAGGSGHGFVGVGSVAIDGRQAAGIIVSDDGGRSWRPVGTIDTAEPGWSLQVDALAVSPSFCQDRTLVARGVESRADGRALTRLWRSTDAGRSWSIWLEEADQPGPALPTTLLMTSGQAGGAIVAALGASVLTPVEGSWERKGGQRRPVWRWAGLGPDVASVTALAAPSNEASQSGSPGTIYAGTNAGPFVSRDGGRTFRPWSDRYDGGGIVALTVSPSFSTDRLVFAVGVGGTIWQIQDSES